MNLEGPFKADAALHATFFQAGDRIYFVSGYSSKNNMSELVDLRSLKGREAHMKMAGALKVVLISLEL